MVFLKSWVRIRVEPDIYHYLLHLVLNQNNLRDHWLLYWLLLWHLENISQCFSVSRIQDWSKKLQKVFTHVSLHRLIWVNTFCGCIMAPFFPQSMPHLLNCEIYHHIWLFVCFLAHLSTTYSRGAFSVVMCPSCVVNNFFKHLLLLNRWANLDQTWQECSLGGPLQKLFTEFDSIKNSGCHGNDIEFFKQFFKNLLLWNHWSDFWNNFTEMFLFKIWIRLKAWLWWMGASCTIWTWRYS